MSSRFEIMSHIVIQQNNMFHSISDMAEKSDELKVYLLRIAVFWKQLLESRRRNIERRCRTLKHFNNLN